MNVQSNFASIAFNQTCHEILSEHPESIGVAYKLLDCGCSLLCGVSTTGDPIGTLMHVSGQPVIKDRKPPICLQCKLDNGLKRVVWEGINWPGGESEMPDKDFRLSIGQKIFGPGYLEPE